MQILEQPQEVQHVVRNWCCGGESIGFVPTMGALHEGHLSLLRQARMECAKVVASVFVNPLQFGLHEDLQQYPRPFERDAELVRAAGCDLLFAPGVKAMYGDVDMAHGSHTVVEVTHLGEIWEGVVRPGHLRGVATVVAKLFNIAMPTRAYFGEKDYQQLKVIEHMVRDLNFNLQVVPLPTVREPDGLAMSSRNAHLSPEARAAAPGLFRALEVGREMAAAGEKNVARLGAAMQRQLEAEPLLQIQYLAAVDAESLKLLEELDGTPARALVAARVGNVRLIDNVALTAGEPG